MISGDEDLSLELVDWSENSMRSTDGSDTGLDAFIFWSDAAELTTSPSLTAVELLAAASCAPGSCTSVTLLALDGVSTVARILSSVIPME